MAHGGQTQQSLMCLTFMGHWLAPYSWGIAAAAKLDLAITSQVQHAKY